MGESLDLGLWRSLLAQSSAAVWTRACCVTYYKLECDGTPGAMTGPASANAKFNKFCNFTNSSKSFLVLWCVNVAGLFGLCGVIWYFETRMECWIGILRLRAEVIKLEAFVWVGLLLWEKVVILCFGYCTL